MKKLKDISSSSVIPVKERVKESRFPGCAGVLAGIREAYSSENAGAAGAMPGNTAGRGLEARVPRGVRFAQAGGDAGRVARFAAPGHDAGVMGEAARGEGG